MTPLRLLLLAACVCAGGAHLPRLSAAVWHVDLRSPAGESADGRARATAFTRIQAGVDAARPGDTVIVYPGIYYEHVGLVRGGAPGAPITIMADEVAADRVVLSGAVPALRERSTKWERVDADLGLYRTPLDHRPTRVLAGRADLLPYPSLEDLRAFRFLADDYPGHLHGFAWDEENRALYVRLRADGKYGPAEPDAVAMAVSPPTGEGRWGQNPAGPGDYNIALRFDGPGHVVVDGFTFETPGIAGVYTEASDVTVRNSWFYGCRIGVAGADGDGRRADRVVVERCFVTHYPAFSDIEDTIRREGAAQRAKKEWWQRIGHWQRKGGLPPASGGVGRAYSYEQGFIRRMGADWIVRDNHFFEVFEGLSNGATSRSTGARIHGNRFERVCDNAVESEDHASDLHIHGNLIIDTFEPISWQPLGGAPLPGPVYVYDNVVWQTPETAALWAISGNSGGMFKIGARDSNWDRGRMGSLPRDVSTAPGGFWVAHNTLLTTEGNFLTRLNPVERRYEGFAFLNNLVVAQRISHLPRVGADSGLVMDHNIVATSKPTMAGEENFAGPGAFAAGPGGRVLAGPEAFGWAAPPGPEHGWVLAPDSPLREAGLLARRLRAADGAELAVPEPVPLRSTPGALPLAIQAGPRPR